MIASARGVGGAASCRRVRSLFTRTYRTKRTEKATTSTGKAGTTEFRLETDLDGEIDTESSGGDGMGSILARCG